MLIILFCTNFIFECKNIVQTYNQIENIHISLVYIAIKFIVKPYNILWCAVFFSITCMNEIKFCIELV